MTRSNQGHTMTLHTYNLLTVPTKYQLPATYSFQDIAQTRFYRSRSVQKGQIKSHHHIAHLHPLTNVPTKYQLPTLYGFQDVAWTRYFRSRSLQQG